MACLSALYIWILTTSNLPEEWVVLVLAGGAIGVAIGRWYALVAALATLALLLDAGPAGVDDELMALLLLFYLPLAAASVAFGIAARRLLGSWLGH